MEWAWKVVRVMVVFLNFAAAFALGFVKGVLVGPIPAVVMIVGNCGVLLGLFPLHAYWVLYTLLRTERLNSVLKFTCFLALPLLFSLWIAVGIVGSILIGLGYGFFAPWMATFEAFRRRSARSKYINCILDGTWETVRGSCTVVCDFADFCYHSCPLYLKEFRAVTEEHETHTIRLVDIPACVLVGLIGIIVEAPIYTFIAIVKSPYMLLKGWQRLLQDLIRGEGIFLETACVPIAGLAIVLWPVAVIGTVVLAFFSGLFVGMYGSIITCQEESFKGGLTYLVAMVAEFDEYSNDWLYLREGSILPKPKYRKNSATNQEEQSTGSSHSRDGVRSITPPTFLVPSLPPSRSIKEVVQEVKLVQVWQDYMKACELEGKALLDEGVIKASDLTAACKSKGGMQGVILGIGLPSFTILRMLLESIKAGSNGILLSDGTELNYMNRPRGRLLDWFFHPVMVLKDQIQMQNLDEAEVRFLERLTLLGPDFAHVRAWNDGFVTPKDPIRSALLQATSRRLLGMTRGIEKFPTYRRMYKHIMKNLIAYSREKGVFSGSCSGRSSSSIEIVQEQIKQNS